MKWNATNIIIAFVIFVVAVYIIYRIGKKQGDAPVVKYPHNGEDIPPSWSPEPLADELHDVMGGLFTLTGTKDTAWTKLKDLPTDEMVIAVYSAFNQKYYKEQKGSLTQWIKDENYYDYTSGVKAATLERLAKLKLV